MIKPEQINIVAKSDSERTTFTAWVTLRREVTVDSFLLETKDYSIPKRFEEHAKRELWHQIYGELIPELDALFEMVIRRPPFSAKAYDDLSMAFTKLRQKLEYKSK